MLTEKIMYVDTEATALHNGAIIQLSGIIEINGEVKKEFNFFVKPHKGASIQQEALKITNSTEKQIFGYPDPREVKDYFESMMSEFVDKYDRDDKFILVGYNTNFDLNMLIDFYKQQGDTTLSYWFDYRHTIDIHELLKLLQFKNRIPIFKNNKLGNVCKELNILENTNKLHDSLEDVRVTREVAKKLLKLF